MEIAKQAIGKIPSLNGTVGCHIICMEHGIAMTIFVGGGTLQREFVSRLDETTDTQNMNPPRGVVHKRKRSARGLFPSVHR